MHDLRALRPVLHLVALFAATLGVLALLISNGYTEHITPPADTTAEQFVKALSAHRYEAALDELAEDTQEQVTVEDLRGLTQGIERAHQGIDQANGEGDETSGDEATARVTVLLDDDREATLELPLVREQGLWKLSSIDPLRQLAE